MASEGFETPPPASPTPGGGPARARTLPRAVLTAILLGGLGLRLLAIDSRGLWFDEGWRVWAARLPTAGDVLHAVWAQPPSAPLYWLALHAWIGLVGHGDVAVRLLSVPAAGAVLLAGYWLGWLVEGRSTGLLAAGLLAVSPLAVEVGQEATMYAWSMLLATLALAAGLAWLQTGRGLRRYVVLGSLLLYTHYMGALLLGALLLAGLVWLGPAPRPAGSPAGSPVGPRRRRWLAAHGLMALVWAPWLVAMGLRMAERWPELSHLSHRAGWAEVYGTALTLAAAASAAATWAPGWQFLVLSLGAVLLGLPLVTRRPALPAGWLVAIVAGGFPIAILGVSAATGAWLTQPRFLALVLPALLVVLAAGLVGALRAARPRALRLLVLVLLGAWLAAQGAGVLAFYRQPVHGRDGLREIGALLTAEVRPGDLVVTNHGLLPPMLAQYYDGPVHALPADEDVRQGYVLWPLPEPAQLPAQQWAVLAPQVPTAGRIWLIYLPFLDPDGALRRQIGTAFPLAAHRSYPFADVDLFAPP